MVECSVCFEPFARDGEKQPKLLPCTHTLCLWCVGQLVNGTMLTCPECREDHALPEGGAQGFPTNR